MIGRRPHGARGTVSRSSSRYPATNIEGSTMSMISKATPGTMHDAATDIPDAGSRRVAIACAALLGLVLVYGAGLASTEILHDGAHDARHAAGFPCH